MYAPPYLVALKHFDEVFAPFCIDERFVPDNFDICNQRGGGGGEERVPRLLLPQEPGAGAATHTCVETVCNTLTTQLHTVCNTLTTHRV